MVAFGEEITQFYLNQPTMDPEEVGILPDTGLMMGYALISLLANKHLTPQRRDDG